MLLTLQRHLDLHLLLLLAELYAEQLRRVEEKICKYEPEFKKRRMDDGTKGLD